MGGEVIREEPRRCTGGPRPPQDQQPGPRGPAQWPPGGRKRPCRLTPRQEPPGARPPTPCRGLRRSSGGSHLAGTAGVKAGGVRRGWCPGVFPALLSPLFRRYVSALTTPARLSPVDFHYSLATQVPTFEITSPNSAHAVSLPPAAPISYRLAEQQPLLRHPAPPPGPSADMQRSYDSYYYPAPPGLPGPRCGPCALGGSLGSLPASPFRIPEDDEYETTQECAPPPPPSSRPRARGSSRRTSAGPRRWRRSRLNGLAAQRARAARDSLSLSSGSGGGSASDDDADDADGALAAESTPFLGPRAAHDALRSDSPPLGPAADSRTYYYSLDSHSARAASSSRHSRGPPPRAPQDSAPL